MQEVVNPQASTQPAVSEDLQTQEQAATVVAQPATQPGEKTDPALLLKSLQEEREEKRRLREEIETLKSKQVPADEEVISDEGRLLKKQIDDLNGKLAQQEAERDLEKVYNKFPALKELSSDFETYKSDFPRHKLENVAKLFLTEKGLLDVPRKGLEKTTGGPRNPVTSDMSMEDSENLRKSNYKAWTDKLKKGLIPTK